MFAALENGAGKAVGVELSLRRVRRARLEARSRGLDARATFLRGDVLDVDLASASVVLCYLSPRASAALKPKLESELRPGARVVVESFPVPGWKIARTIGRGYVDYYERNDFYLYVMPVRAAQRRSPDPTVGPRRHTGRL